MEYTVIFFTADNAACQQQFKTYAEAEYFDNTLLAAGYATSGVLGH